MDHIPWGRWLVEVALLALLPKTWLVLVVVPSSKGRCRLHYPHLFQFLRHYFVSWETMRGPFVRKETQNASEGMRCLG